MDFDNVNVNVSGPVQPTSTYKTKVLKGNHPFASQVTEPNTKYVIKHDFVLDGDVTIPSNCVLEFDGGSLSNGCVINCGKIINNSNSVIFREITFHNPTKQKVYLKWFGYNSFANSLENAAKFGEVDCDGNWNIDRTVLITNDIKLHNGTFNGFAGSNNIVIQSNDVTDEYTYSQTINANSNSLSHVPDGNYSHVAVRASDKWFDNGSRHGLVGEVFDITKINEDNINIGQSTVCSYTENIKIKYFNVIKVFIDNIIFVCPKVDNDAAGTILSLYRCDAVVKNCHFSGLSKQLSFNMCVNSICETCNFTDYYPWGFSFGDGTINSSIINSVFLGGRHGITALGEDYVVKYNTIKNNNLSNCSEAINNHCNAYYTVIDNNVIINSKCGIGLYAPCNIVKNNVISDYCGGGSNNNGIYCLEAGFINLIASGNTIINYNGYGSAIQASLNIEDCTYQLEPEYFYVTDNYINNVPNMGGIYVGNVNVPVRHIHITGNVINKVGYSSIKASGVNKSLCVCNNFISREFRTSSHAIELVGLPDNFAYVYAVVLNNFFDDRVGNGAISVSSVNYLFAKYNLSLTQRNMNIDIENVTAMIGNHGIFAASDTDFASDDFSIRYENMLLLNSTTKKLIYKVSGDTKIYKEFDGAKMNVNRSGVFNDKPNDSDIYIGFKYFCTDRQTTEGATNGIEIIYKGNSVWVDALGRVVS